MQREFICDIANDILKTDKEKVDKEVILDMKEDIAVYFDKEEEEEYTTSQ